MTFVFIFNTVLYSSTEIFLKERNFITIPNRKCTLKMMSWLVGTENPDLSFFLRKQTSILVFGKQSQHMLFLMLMDSFINGIYELSCSWF